jgi:hypothetical protein
VRQLVVALAIPIFIVTNTSDSGFGSLRDAMESLSRQCIESSCEIRFAIPPPVPESGWFTIRPLSPLPSIDATKLVVDGASQTAVTGDTNPYGPEIEINGGDCGDDCNGIVIALPSAAKPGREFHIENLAINGFSGAGILINLDRPWYFYSTIRHNYLGVDPTGTFAVPNLRGLMSSGATTLDVQENLISGNRLTGVWITSDDSPLVRDNLIGVARDGETPLPNGASGIFFGPGTRFGAAFSNRIAFNRDFGIAVSRETQWMEIRGNSMKGNGQLGIDIGLDLITPTDAPVLISATFEAGKTIVRGRVAHNLGGDCFPCTPSLEFYSSTALDAHGMTQGETQHVARFDITTADEFTATIDGDLTGRYIAATATRTKQLAKTVTPNYLQSWGATSEFSNPVRVEP